MPVPTTQKIRFGAFELDRQTGELYKNGTKLKLQGQPIAVLALLLESPGELVSREKIRKHLWPEDTFVDFEHSLNTHIKKLRQVFEDDAETPRYIETLPRRGYRFIGRVEPATNSPEAVDDPAKTLTAPVEDANKSNEALPSEPPSAPKPTSWRYFAAVALLLIVTGGALYWLARPEPVPKVSNYTQLTHDGLLKELIGTDGARLYLGLGTFNLQGIAAISIAGGQPTKIPGTSLGMYPVDLSPNGSDLLVSERGDFWSLPVLGGSPRRLGDTVGQGAAWSPDAKMLAYCRGIDLFVAKADGTESRKLVTIKDVRSISRPVWSPDGSHLRFDSSSPSDPSSIWEVSVEGTDLHQVLPGFRHPPNECCGKWTSDGSYFVFQSENQIWALPRKGGLFRSEAKPVQLTNSPMTLSTAVPSKDGKKLFVVGRTLRGEMVRYDARSDQFVLYLGGISAEQVDFSKDGKWVTYISYPEWTLWRSKADGSERLQLTYPPISPLVPRWSPDGKQIVFMTMPPDQAIRIYEISAEGGNPRPLLPDDPSPQGDPTWSPDGRKIVFGGHSRDPAATIRVIDLTTRQVSTLPGSQGIYSPRWSPDGRYVVATTIDESTLLLFDFQTQKWTELAKGSFDWPTWSKDGQYIYIFDSTADFSVLRIRISDGKTERVVGLKNLVFAGVVIPWLGLAPDDSPLLLRDSGTSDVYALDWKQP